jgi:hypothetical protein
MKKSNIHLATPCLDYPYLSIPDIEEDSINYTNDYERKD